MKVEQAKSKLDKYVTLRGSIAHRGSGQTTCRKVQVRDYLEHVKQLAGRTGGLVNLFVRHATGKALWRLGKLR